MTFNVQKINYQLFKTNYKTKTRTKNDLNENFPRSKTFIKQNIPSVEKGSFREFDRKSLYRKVYRTFIRKTIKL